MLAQNDQLTRQVEVLTTIITRKKFNVVLNKLTELNLKKNLGF
jgi:hypothetical protein